MATPALAPAVVNWVNTFGSLSRHCDVIQDCADGGIFYEILSEIDGQWFKLVRSIDTGDNWVLKFNNLKKLYKLLTGFYEEVLGQNTAALDVPNLTAIARDSDVAEILKLAQLIIALAVQCEQNQRYIVMIQGLDAGSQHALMLAIEQVMSKLAAGGTKSSNDIFYPDTPTALSPVARKDAEELEAANDLLRKQLSQLQFKYDELVSEKKDLQSGLLDMEHSISQLSGAGKVDFILRTEIDNLKVEVEKSENRRAESEALVEKQATMIKDLTKKVDNKCGVIVNSDQVDEALVKAEETSRLKDQLDEFRHVADKLQKSEAMIEKYKKKMEESAEMRRQSKAIESQNQQLSERNRQLEEEYRKLSGFRPLMETYKEQIGALEAKNSSFQVENSRMEFELKETKNKLERLEIGRRNDQDMIEALEDQVRNLDRARITQLEQQLEKYKLQNEDQSEQKVTALKSQLEEVTRLKEKFEQDYMHSFKKNLAFENEMTQLRSMAQPDGQAVVDSLRSTVNEYQQELAQTKRRLAEVESALGQVQSSAGGAGSPIGASGPDYEKIKRQLDSFEKESRLQMGQINKLLKEKDLLESQSMELKDGLLQQERTNSDLKAALAALESKGQSADETTQKLAAVTQKMVQLTEQNTKLHKALKEAKKHILSQDKQIKDHKAIVPKVGHKTIQHNFYLHLRKDNFVETITSYEATVRDKDAELNRIKLELADTRKAARREQHLMLSAWHDMMLNHQRRVPGMRSDGSKSLTTAPFTHRMAKKGKAKKSRANTALPPEHASNVLVLLMVEAKKQSVILYRNWYLQQKDLLRRQRETLHRLEKEKYGCMRQLLDSADNLSGQITLMDAGLSRYTDEMAVKKVEDVDDEEALKQNEELENQLERELDHCCVKVDDVHDFQYAGGAAALEAELRDVKEASERIAEKRAAEIKRVQAKHDTSMLATGKRADLIISEIETVANKVPF
ncbi:hypothetical protein HK101_000313 [Irineochytrium annulatum]|nr:hypothetical protein HK101_000313 [Irineochytrium annulatum]